MFELSGCSAWAPIQKRLRAALSGASGVTYGRASGLGQWFGAGYFSASVASSKKFILHADANSFGNALLSDWELMRNHAGEQRVHLANHLRCGMPACRAWTVVTAYYWSFFLAVGLSRVLGRTPIFLDAQAALGLGAATGKASKHGAGCYSVRLVAPFGGTSVSLDVRRSSARVHEAVWRELFGSLDEVCNESRDDLSMDYQAFESLRGMSTLLGPDWPSEVRNAVNYRGGVAYAEATRAQEISLARLMGALTESEDGASALSRMGYLAREVRGTSIGAGTVGNWSELVLRLGILLDELCVAVESEVAENDGHDRRWRVSRNDATRRLSMPIPLVN